MKLKDALEIGKESGLDTVGEALYNIKIHSMNIFSYDNMQNEWDELIGETYEKVDNLDTKIDDVLSEFK